MANNLLVHKSQKTKDTIKTMSSKSKYCFFPVYTERPKHWFLSLIVKENKGTVKFFIFDSCPTKMAERMVKETLGPMIREIFEIENESYIVNVNIPKQMNGDDCGIYMMKCIYTILAQTHSQERNKRSDEILDFDESWFIYNCTTSSIKHLRKDLFELCSSVMSDTKLDVAYRGMINNGKCCWIISTLQFLFTKLEWFHKLQHEQKAKVDVDKVWEAMSSILSRTIVIKQLQEKTATRISGDYNPLPKDDVSSFISILTTSYPNNNVATLCIASEQNKVDEQDCSELLRLLCDGSKHCTDANFTTEYEFRVCNECKLQYEMPKRDEQSVLLLYFNDNIGEVTTMESFIEESLREETFKHRCKRCYCIDKKLEANEENMAAKVPDEEIDWRDHRQGRLLFKNYPATLMVSIQRATGLDIDGIFTQVKKKNNVDIFINDGKIKLGEMQYCMEAVVYHQGEDPTYGHFWCESKRPTVISNEENEREYIWHEFNDGKVKVLSKEHRKKCANRNTSSWKKRTSECSLVMYKKMNV
jgi:hypothetical protein